MRGWKLHCPSLLPYDLRHLLPSEPGNLALGLGVHLNSRKPTELTERDLTD
ncbi:uncharacterized protein L969DRAFT_90573 [Mixia osmundae IAM 14324]|uniref:uncharacterized protein n=1 Tax=Mixia osmundae (strain CBS 9802 / IAM 14324 / JCM 22182 / KY 12970) TaxID=764103 RepID=UPI0004A552F0|nr:uncharacterized protein L969DRAFT_90573 [Mixia osmundae IAM 14324]KEI36606.1 hypothetical protein L969DRAFT_90573 [Mixia osmundae IAM 14324]